MFSRSWLFSLVSRTPGSVPPGARYSGSPPLLIGTSEAGLLPHFGEYIGTRTRRRLLALDRTVYSAERPAYYCKERNMKFTTSFKIWEAF